jgi:hypothetical protein
LIAAAVRWVEPASLCGRLGFSADEIAWLLDHVDGEIVVMRPAGPEHLTPRASRARAIAVSPRLNRA